jgi:hypothetical protein
MRLGWLEVRVGRTPVLVGNITFQWSGQHRFLTTCDRTSIESSLFFKIELPMLGNELPK